MIAQPNGLRYNDDCGWYAVKNGRCIQPEIDGTLASARAALIAARPASGGFDSSLTPDEKFENSAVHSRVSFARKYDEQEAKRQAEREAYAATKPAHGGFDKLTIGLASIDWHNVEPLEDDERCVDENPSWLYLPF